MMRGAFCTATQAGGIDDEHRFRRREVSRGPGRGEAPAGRRCRQRLFGPARGARRLQGPVSLGGRRRQRLVRPARPRHHQPQRRLRGCPAHHLGDGPAAAGRCRHGLGRGLQHLAHDRGPRQVRRRRLSPRRPGAGQALRPPSGQGARLAGGDGRSHQGSGRRPHRSGVRDHGAHRRARRRRPAGRHRPRACSTSLRAPT